MHFYLTKEYWTQSDAEKGRRGYYEDDTKIKNRTNVCYDKDLSFFLAAAVAVTAVQTKTIAYVLLLLKRAIGTSAQTEDFSKRGQGDARKVVI